MRKRLIISLVFALGTIILVQFAIPGHIGILEWYCGDFLFFLRGPDSSADGNVAVVTIDDRTLRENPYGVWPWQRAHYADIITRLSKWEPASIVLTMVFDQPGGSDGDRELAHAIKESRNVLLTGYLSRQDERISQKLVPVYPLAIFRQHAAGDGFGNAVIDGDGVVRKIPLAVNEGHNDKRWLSLALVTVLHYLGLGPESAREEASSLRIDCGGFKADTVIPLERQDSDSETSMRLNFRGSHEQFLSVSYLDLYNGSFDGRLLQNKIVLVGETLPGKQRTFKTPLSHNNELTSVELMANGISTILDKRFLSPPSPGAVFIYIVMFALVSSLVFFSVRPGISLVILLIIIIAAWSGSFIAFMRGVLLPVAAPLAASLVLYLSGVIYHYTGERRRRMLTARAFKHYVSPNVVGQILTSKGRLSLGGKKRTLTILFSDIAGFTTVSESVSAETLVEWLNEYLSEMSSIILEEDGTIDKYIGDAIVAFWNAPLDQPDHAVRVCRAALKMQKRLETLNAEWEAQGRPRLDTRIGVNTGEVIVGNIGSSERFDYTVIGDNVNLASRLEGINKYYGTSIIISFATFNLAMEHIEIRELDFIKVKGKKEPVSIMELVGEAGKVDKEKDALIRMFEEALSSYRMGKWDKADHEFSAILEEYPDDKPSRLFLERSRALKENLPSEWDGVYLFDKK